MKQLAILTVVLLVALVALTGLTGQTASARSVDRSCMGVVKGVYFYRNATWNWQRKLGVRRTHSAFRASRTHSCKYARWVAHQWMHRALVEKKKYFATDPKTVICYVFGRYCRQALAVAYCETGGTYWVGSQNGQYKGLFQMGSSERAKYGHGPDALTQARSAYSYFADTHYSWSPWECKP